jgi:hypothetical protein
VTAADKTPTLTPPPERTEKADEYAAIVGLPTMPPDPLIPGQRMKNRGKTAYQGLIAVVQALSDCSDVFPPLKSVCNVILTIHKAYDVRTIHSFIYKIYLHISGSQRVSTNKDELEKLKVKLKAILSIVNKYKQYGGIEVLRHRIESFCEWVGLTVFESI